MSGFFSLLSWSFASAYQGDIFLFVGRHRNRVKVLVWDHSGFWICAKRLERGTFAIPADTVGADKLSAASLSTAEVHLLLNGLTPSCPANGLRTQVYVDAT